MRVWGLVPLLDLKWDNKLASLTEELIPLIKEYFVC